MDSKLDLRQTLMDFSATDRGYPLAKFLFKAGPSPSVTDMLEFVLNTYSYLPNEKYNEQPQVSPKPA